MSFRFIDLFAGLGGFHVALGQLGGRCVLASELNTNLRNLYGQNFPLTREIVGDIHDVQTKTIPKHDVLCAGFPCQPFSQAGKRMGLKDPKNGNHFYKILDIAKVHKPALILLENVPNLEGHDGGRTWRTMKRELSVQYHVHSGKLSPRHCGIPQNRKRFYAVCILKTHDLNWQFPDPDFMTTDIDFILGDHVSERKRMVVENHRQIERWQEFAAYFSDFRIPSFPVWATEFGATYQLSETVEGILANPKKGRGAFGENLVGEDQLPPYAKRGGDFPRWKEIIIMKNRKLFLTHSQFLMSWVEPVKFWHHSHQKFEWNCGDENPTFEDKIIQFRPSGIRVTTRKYSPALVLTGTQRPIIFDNDISSYRYLTSRESARLQSFPEEFILPSSSNERTRALGNAVNSDVISFLIDDLIKQINFDD